jgi:hypothetical protein
MRKAMNITLRKRTRWSLSKAPSNSSRKHSISKSLRSMEEDAALSRSDALLLGGMRRTRGLSIWDKPQGHMEEPPVRPRRSTRSSDPPPYTPRHSKIVSS